MFKRKKKKEMTRKPISQVLPDSFGKALFVAKKIHSEWSSSPWFHSTKLIKVNDEYTVSINVDPKYLNEVNLLMTEDTKKDGVLVTFSHNHVQPKVEGNDIWAG